MIYSRLEPSDFQPVPDCNENSGVDYCPILMHIADGLLDSIDAPISTFSCTCIEDSKARICIGVGF